MKIALLGKGKTGSKLLDFKQHEFEIFHSQRPPTFEELKTCQVIISFLPGEAFKKYIPLLMETQLPVVTGSTGFEWPNHIHQDLIKRGASWIYASNFSMGVAIMGRFLQQLTKASQLFTTYQVSIHEVHHTKKLDAPSGTALSMQQWLNLPCSVTSERTGDVIGYHELVFDTGKEKLKLSHEALDRKLFAEGALWAAQYLINNPKPGLHSFQDIMEKNL